MVPASSTSSEKRLLRPYGDTTGDGMVQVSFTLPLGSTDWSSPRAFAITSKSTKFEVPDNATLRSRILNKARPRSLGPTFTPYSTWSTAKKNDLDPYVSRLINEVKLQMTALPDLSDSRWPIVMRRSASAPSRTAPTLRATPRIACAWRCTADRSQASRAPDSDCSIRSMSATPSPIIRHRNSGVSRTSRSVSIAAGSRYSTGTGRRCCAGRGCAGATATPSSGKLVEIAARSLSKVTGL